MLLPLISALPFHDFLSFQKIKKKKKQGSEVVGTPFGHEALVAAHLESVLVEHHIFISAVGVVVVAPLCLCSRMLSDKSGPSICSG